MVGVKGIVAKETTRSFVIVTKDNKSKMLLKQGCVFRVRLPYEARDVVESAEGTLVVDLWGDMILYKGSERTKIKFKERGPLNLY